MIFAKLSEELKIILGIDEEEENKPKIITVSLYTDVVSFLEYCLQF